MSLVISNAIQGFSLNVQYRRLSELKPNGRNPRQHSLGQIRQIARSIEAFGFNVPVLVDQNLNVIAGHGRVLASEHLKLDEIPTIQIEHLTNAQAQAFAIADNRLTENSVWDEKLLGESLRELTALNLDFSLDVTGFTMAEIDLRIEGLADLEQPDALDEMPFIEPGPSITQVGDLWLLGKHRLLCGNALEPSTYERLMQGNLADVIFTDPPYNVRIQGHVSGNGSISHREFSMASGEMSEDEFTSFLSSVCKLLAFHSKAGSIHFICMDWRHIHELMVAGRAAYSELKNLCVWTKDNGGMGSLYRSQHELVFVWKSGIGPHVNNVQLGQYGRNRTNVWSYPGVGNFGRKGEEGNLLAMHPTVKPVNLVADALLDCSNRGDVVLDPFLGSGSSILAAERVGRVCYGCELDPLYADTAIRRWQRYTGEAAIHAETGVSFDQTMEANHG